MSHLTNDTRTQLLQCLLMKEAAKILLKLLDVIQRKYLKNKNNKIISNPLKLKSKILCKKLDRFPYVWNLSKEIYDMHSKKNEAQAPLWYLDQLEDFIPLFLWFYVRISTFKITIERQNAYEKVGFCRVFEIICYIWPCK